MATEVKIPAMGESISSGILAAWHVKDGDYVEKNQPIYELETDKITSEANAEVSGALSIKTPEGEEVAIGQVVAEIDESASPPAASKEASAAEAASESESGPVEAPESGTVGESSAPSGPSPAPAEAEPPRPTSETGAGQGGDDAALSPAARKALEENNLQPKDVEGTGKGGRITKADVMNAVKTGAAPRGGEETTATKPAPEEPSSGEAGPTARRERETRKKMTPLRRKIAERLVTASQETAMLTTFNEVDMSAVLSLRKKLQDEFVEKHEIKLGFMSFFVKAATQALRAIPQVNARIEGQEIVEQHYYDIGVAVGTDKGLMVPVIRDCETKSFAAIESDISHYAQAARDGKIQISDLEGGVFTISNGGIYGSMLSTPIMNHPQPAILGLHNIQERAVVRDGEVVARPMMYLALSYDHRIIDGKEAVTFLNKIKEMIEDPNRLLFDL